MLVEAGSLIVLGVVVALLSWYAPYRRHAARRLADRTGAHVPAQQEDALEARTARRSRAIGAGVVLAGVVLAVVHAATDGALVESGGWMIVGLVFTLGAAGLAVVEIWRPGTPDGTRTRTARTSVPTLTDYLPGYTAAVTWGLTGAGIASTCGTWLLTGSPWFDGATVRASAVPVMTVLLPVLAVLTGIAVRRVLDSPQPARDETELFWQDAVRASTLSALHVPVALVGLFTTWVTARTLDAAASAVATISGQTGPDWTGAVLVLGYVLAPALVVAALAVTLALGKDNERTRFRRRLWPSGDDAAARAGA